MTAWRITSGGVTLHLRVTPNAGADRLEGIEMRGDGTAVLRIRVAAVPDKGRANAAVVTLLAKALGLPKSALRITAGETARFKTVALAGDGDEIAGRLAILISPKPLGLLGSPLKSG